MTREILLKVLGIDPSSSSSGGASVEKGKLLRTMLWKKTQGRSHPWNLHDFFETVELWIAEEEPDVACIESLSVARGAKVTRVLAFFQAGAVLACKECGIPVIELRVSSARKIALGNGGLAKEEAHAAVKQMFPKHKFRAYNQGGNDETDAVVLGVAGPEATEN